jgi:hypothetical protein
LRCKALKTEVTPDPGWLDRGALMRYSLVIKTLLMCQQHLKNSLTYGI